MMAVLFHDTGHNCLGFDDCAQHEILKCCCTAKFSLSDDIQIGTLFVIVTSGHRLTSC